MTFWSNTVVKLRTATMNWSFCHEKNTWKYRCTVSWSTLSPNSLQSKEKQRKAKKSKAKKSKETRHLKSYLKCEKGPELVHLKQSRLGRTLVCLELKSWADLITITPMVFVVKHTAESQCKLHIYWKAVKNSQKMHRYTHNTIVYVSKQTLFV